MSTEATEGHPSLGVILTGIGELPSITAGVQTMVPRIKHLVLCTAKISLWLNMCTRWFCVSTHKLESSERKDPQLRRSSCKAFSRFRDHSHGGGAIPALLVLGSIRK